jgi:crossover junction endodeoxyribonuclease RuvC
VTTALIVGQARGVALLAAARAGLPIREYKPMAVKQAITGYGKASKSQMQEMVRMLLHLDDLPRPDDAADAIAVAICHVYSARLERLIGLSDDVLE